MPDDIRRIYLGGYESIYTIDRHAVITNTETNEVLSGWIEKRGYRAVSLKIPHTSPTQYQRICVHRLMAITFLPNPSNLSVVNHKDGNKLNNDLTNLEWCTYQYNYEHARNMGLIKTGGELSYAAITDQQAHEICSMIADGYKNVEIIDALGLPNDQRGKGLITRIRTGRAWKDVSSQYDFEKKGSLRKVNDDIVRAICKDICDKKSVKEIFKTTGIANDLSYQRLKGLVYDIRTGKSFRDISSGYGFIT